MNDWIPSTAKFRTCHGVPSNGSITIEAPISDFAGFSPKCRVLSGIIGKPKGLETSIDCNRIGNVWQIIGFLDIPELTTISIEVRVKTLGVNLTNPLTWMLKTYNDTISNILNDYENDGGGV